MARERAGHYGHGFVGAFHDVVTACTMDVDVDESRNSGLLHRSDFLRARRQAHIRARTNGLDNAVANENSGIGDFGCGS